MTDGRPRWSIHYAISNLFEFRPAHVRAASKFVKQRPVHASGTWRRGCSRRTRCTRQQSTARRCHAPARSILFINRAERDGSSRRSSRTKAASASLLTFMGLLSTFAVEAELSNLCHGGPCWVISKAHLAVCTVLRRARNRYFGGNREALKWRNARSAERGSPPKLKKAR